jgi:hypothetical protein
MKLISMTDFVLEEVKNWHANSPTIIINYANFLKQPLELWMFVPCDEDGNVISESYNDEQHVIIQHLEYAEAKERCLFEGFEIDGGIVWHKAGLDNTLFIFGLCEDKYKTIEDLVSSRFPNLILTPTAIKQIGL